MFCAERRAQCCKIVRKFNFTHDYFVGKWNQNKFVFSANVYAKKERIFGNKIFSYCLFKLSCLTRIFTGLKFCELLFSSSVCVGRAM